MIHGWQFGLHCYNCRGCWDNDALPGADLPFPEDIHSSVYFVSNLMRLTRENIPTIKPEIRELTEWPKAISLAVWDQGPSLKFFGLFSQTYIACWNSKQTVRSNFIQNMNTVVTHPTHRLLKAEYRRVQPRFNNTLCFSNTSIYCFVCVTSQP